MGVVVCPGHPRQRGDRHLGSKGEQGDLHEQGEAAARSCPGYGDEVHAMLGTVHAGHTRRQERLVREEVEVTPALPRRVVHRAGAL